MNANLRFPKITGQSYEQQMVQVQSYLHQLVQQLNWAFENVSSVGSAKQLDELSKLSGGIAESAEAQATFNEIKSLIIKSADIVNAYYDSINTKLKGIYVAQSDFGVYSDETAATISGNSTSIQQMYSNIQMILTDIENLEHSLIEANAYIHSGLLYYDEDGAPVYGLEIGQRNEIDGVEVFNKYARFTADKLSFYDSNDNEVAYISDKKLYITHVEVTGSLTEGGFVDTILANGDTVTKWVGIGG